MNDMKMTVIEAVANRGPIRWAAWRILNRLDRGLMDDVAQTVAMKFLRNHPADEKMPTTYWYLAGKRVAIAVCDQEMRYVRLESDEDGQNGQTHRVDRRTELTDPFNLEAWMMLREVVSHPVGRKVAALVLKRNSGVVLSSYERVRLYRARDKLRRLALA